MTLKPACLQWSEDGKLRSADYSDVYFQRNKGPAESDYVFLAQSRLPERLSRSATWQVFRIAELGFGTGLNFMLTARLFLTSASAQASLDYVSFEKHPLRPADLARVHADWPELAADAAALQAQYPPPVAGTHRLFLAGGRIRLTLVYGDVTETLPQTMGRFDAWYLDGFSPDRNPAMWTPEIFRAIAARTRADGTVATFSAARAVREGLVAAGFVAEKTKGFGVKRKMTVAQMPAGATPDEQMPDDKTVIVLGAGIAGCAAARAMALRGWQVTLVDSGDGTASGASGNPRAIVYPKLTVGPVPLGQFHAAAFIAARSLLTALDVPSWQPCGALMLDTDADTATRHAAICADGHWPEELARVLPPAAEGSPPNGGLFLPLAGHVSPADFCRALADHANITPRFGLSAAALEQRDGIWHVLDKAGESQISARRIIIATGTAAAGFAQTAWLPLQHLRGQVTLVRQTPASEKLGHVLCHDGYITPAVDGLHCIGATFQKEQAAPAAEPRTEDDLQNLRQLNAFLPQLGFAPADISGNRAGFRATTPDKLPLAGPCPDYAATVEVWRDLRTGKTPATSAVYHDGLYISAGFGAHGMTGAVLAAEILAHDIAGDTLPLPAALAAHLRPERFIARGLKRGTIPA